MGPLNRQTGSQMSHSCLCGIVRSLWLRNVNDGSRHATNEDYASICLALHQVLCNGDCEEICAINVDAPELADTIDWVIDGFEVLGESGGCDQVVNLAMLLDDLCDCGVDGLGGGDISVVSCDFGDSVDWGLVDVVSEGWVCILLCTRVFSSERCHQLLGLLLGFLLYYPKLASATISRDN